MAYLTATIFAVVQERPDRASVRRRDASAQVQVQGADTEPLDGGALSQRGARSPARGPAVAPSSSSPPARLAVSRVRRAAERERRAREEGKGANGPRVWRGPAGAGVFSLPKMELDRRIQIDGQRCSGPNRAQAGKRNPGPGLGYGLGAGEAPRAPCAAVAAGPRALLLLGSGLHSAGPGQNAQ